VTDAIDRALREVLPEPNPFAFTIEDAYAYWQASLEHAYRLAKAKRAHELQHGGRHREWSSEGVHAFSAAYGRAMAIEMLLPGLTALWHIGQPEATDFVPAAKQLAQAAVDDAEAEFLAKTKLGLLAEMEPAA
jgi:hypothetical protein